MDENQMKLRYNPDNILQGKRILGFKSRNFKEAVISVLIIAFIIFQIPFVPKVRWVFIVCIGTAVFLINAIGIKNQSITELIINYFQLKPYINAFHYRRLTDVKRDNSPVVENSKIVTVRKNKAKESARKIIKKKS